ncbi:MAG: carboxypeptidase-like regulatory domain-containing protein [Thermofilum sp.]
MERCVIAAALIVLALAPLLVNAEALKSPDFYARIDVLVTTEEIVEIDFGAKSDVLLVSATTLPGFTLERFVAVFEGGAPKGIVPVVYDKRSENMGVLASLVSYTGEIKLSSNGYNGTCKVRLITVQRKTSWQAIRGDITLDTSEYRGAGFDNVVVRVTIDNYAPYIVKDVLDQQGNSLFSVEFQKTVEASAVKFDLKHVELKVSKLGFGKYTVKLQRNEAFALPGAMLVIEDSYTEYTVAPKSTKALTLKNKLDWKPLGWIIVAYSVAPGPMREPQVKIEGDIVDLAAERRDQIDVRGASLLIPPFLLHYWIEAYTVYGATVKITNLGRDDIRIIAVPVYYREVGVWTPRGLEVSVSSRDLGDAYAAFIVVQVPSLARITSLTLPSGQVLERLGNYTSGWGSEWRSIVVEEHEAAVQVKNGAQVEEGTYFFSIEWPTLLVKPVDSKRRPVIGAEVVVEGPVKITAVSEADGAARVKPYAPGVYTVAINYRGAKVGEATLATLTGSELLIPCSLYDLQVNVKTALSSPVSGAVVSVESQGGFKQELETDDSGKVVFTQLPGGTYTVRAEYKGVSAQQTVNLNADASVDLNLWILFELPLIGPVTAATAAAAGAVTAVVAGAAFSRRRREVAEIDIG